MLPQTTGIWIMRMLMEQEARYGQWLCGRSRESENATKRVLLHQEIACGERQRMFWHDTGIFKAIFGMQMANDGAIMTPEVFRRHKDSFANLRPRIRWAVY